MNAKKIEKENYYIILKWEIMINKTKNLVKSRKKVTKYCKMAGFCQKKLFKQVKYDIKYSKKRYGKCSCMKVLDNKIEKLGNDLKDEIKKDSKCYIASAVFSMYGFYEYK